PPPGRRGPPEPIREMPARLGTPRPPAPRARPGLKTRSAVVDPDQVLGAEVPNEPAVARPRVLVRVEDDLDPEIAAHHRTICDPDPEGDLAGMLARDDAPGDAPRRSVLPGRIQVDDRARAGE